VSKNKQPLASMAASVYLPLTDYISPDQELFSDLESEILNYSPVW
jgi:hypothetical protein